MFENPNLERSTTGEMSVVLSISQGDTEPRRHSSPTCRSRGILSAKMMKKIFSLFVSDLDGTLLTSKNQITYRTKEAIDQFQRNGGMFTIATGRSLIECRNFINNLQIQLPVILCNGAMLYYPHEEEIQVIKTIPKHVADRLHLSIQNITPLVDMLVFSPTQIYSLLISAQKATELAKIGITTTPIQSIAEVEEDIIKLQMIGSAKNAQTLRSFATDSTLRNECDFVQSHEYYYEVVPKGISKGNALHYLNQILQIPTQETAVIGDHCNDISMIKSAGFSATVKNAHLLARQYSSVHVPSNNQEGVAYFIENYLL